MAQLFLWIVLVVMLQTGQVRLVCDISNCDTNHCNGYNCGSCLDGYYLYDNGYCYACQQNCKTCDARLSCTECNPGYYGSYCQTPCPRCKEGACDKSNGTCTTGCVDRYYLFGGYCYQCEANCRTCSNDTICTACIESYFVNSQSCSKCRDRCNSCTGWDLCSECKEAYHRWGSSCQYYCTGCFSSCNKEDGCSAGCDAKYFKKWNGAQNGYVCKNCPQNCRACTHAQFCQSCESGYWGSKCQNSCEGCKYNACDKSRGCTSGCKHGFYRPSALSSTYCYGCPANCEMCTSSTSCSTCKAGYNGTTCQHDCPSCNGNVCNWGDGQCTHVCTNNQFFDTSQVKCQNCPDGCLSCSSSINCKTCITGKWGSRCDDSCSQNCQQGTCYKSNGYCSPCKAGYWGNKCESDCLPGCDVCNYGTQCQTCKIGYFSIDNNKKCECSEHECTVLDGETCPSCKKNEWYPFGLGCCPCSDMCKDNICFANRTCVDCKDLTIYGDRCEIPCDQNCKNSLCHRDGSCVLCRYDYLYGSKCKEYCISAIAQCSACYGQDSSIPTCTRCNMGYYVNENKCVSCSNNCKHGSEYCNTTNGHCTYGCKTDWFNDRCTSRCNVTNCHLCPTPNECTECSDGFYAESMSSCRPCPANCQVGSFCSKYNGSCTGCIEGHAGENCTETCNPSCKTCLQFNITSCDICSPGFFGASCERNCNAGCKSVNQTRLCDKINGYCEFGCEEGLWGNTCESSCGVGCTGKTCNRTTGYCLSDCQDTHFGHTCDDQCNENCGTTTGRICNETDGYCLNDCQVGWFGGQCDHTCGGTCKDNICDRNNGSCTSGCIDGFTGSMCMQVLGHSEQTESDSLFTQGLGAGLGVAVVGVACIVVALIVRKRRTNATSENADPVVASESQVTDETKPAHEYQNLALDTIMSPDQHTSNSNVSQPVYQELNQEARDGSEYSTLDESSPRNTDDGDYTSLDPNIVSKGDGSTYSRLDTNAY